jgi:hypothetical protein
MNNIHAGQPANQPPMVGEPPYPGTPGFTAGREYNPAIGNLTTNPYFNGLSADVNQMQNELLNSQGLGYPPPGGAPGNGPPNIHQGAAYYG